MIEIFKTFGHFLLHPFLSHEYLAKKREGRESRWPFENPPLQLSLWEGISVSWFFFLLNSIITLIILVLSHKYIFALFQQSKDWQEGLGQAELLTKRTTYYWIFTAASVVFFPLWLYLKMAVWRFIVNLSCRIFAVKSYTDQVIDSVLIGGLSSFFLLPVPIFGGMAKFFSQCLIVYAGLTRQLQMTGLQALLVLFMPFLLLIFLGGVFLFVISLMWGILMVP